jgi:hypothetical protein
MLKENEFLKNKDKKHNKTKIANPILIYQILVMDYLQNLNIKIFPKKNRFSLFKPSCSPRISSLSSKRSNRKF